jgi:hypothetical protein
MEIDDFPYCCKAFILYSFPNDHYRTQQKSDGNYRYWTPEEIEAKISGDLADHLGNYTEYEEYMYIAAISAGQMIAKRVFERAGFTQFGTTVNEGSYDGQVWYYSKLVQNDIWDGQEEDSYYDI